MSKLEFKKKILEAGKAEHQSVIDDFRTRIAELRDSTDESEEDAHVQSDDNSDERFSEVNRIADELSFANEELIKLNRIVIEDAHEEIQFGSVVETDQRRFFISVSIEAFKADGKDIFGISTKAPLYGEMQGKKKGDSFEFNGISYQIEDVY